jgi:hypothetical protein
MACKIGEKLNRFCGGGIFFILILAACASAPRPEEFYADRKDSFALMAPGADIYFTADVAEARPILDTFSLGTMEGREIAEFFDMTSSITAALYNTGSHRFLAAGRGRYPSVRGGIYFSSSKDWTKKKSVSEIEYWYSAKSNLSVYLNSASVYVSDADPFVPAPGAESPAVLADIRAGSVLSGWMDKPDSALNAIISALGVPVTIPARRLIFAVYRADPAAPGETGNEALYYAALRLETTDKNQAAGLVRVFSVVKLASELIDFSSIKREQGINVAGMAQFFFANAPAQDGNAIILKTGIMKGSKLALLFNMLSVYSK